MTMVVPCRLITRQRSHMGLTDGRTFMALPVPVGDSTAVEVVRTELDLDLVARKDADVVLAHLPGDRGEDGMASFELHPEHRARERLDDLAFHLDLLFLCRHRTFLECLPLCSVNALPEQFRAHSKARSRRTTIVANQRVPASESWARRA